MCRRLLNLCTLFGCCKHIKPQILRGKITGFWKLPLWYKLHFYYFCFIWNMNMCCKYPFTSGVRLPRNSWWNIQTSSEAHPAFYSVGYVGFYPGSSAVKAWTALIPVVSSLRTGGDLSLFPPYLHGIQRRMLFFLPNIIHMPFIKRVFRVILNKFTSS